MNELNNMKMTGYASKDRPWIKYYDILPEEVEIPNNNLYEFIYENNKRHLDDIALNYYHRKINYKELFANVDRLTVEFIELGIKKGDVVSICSLTTPEMLYSFFALSRIGAISNMIDPRIGNEGIKNHINENGSRVLITLDVFGAKMNELVNDTSLDKIITFSLGDSLPKIKEFILSMKLKNQIKQIEFKGNVYTNDDFYNKKKYSKIKDIATGEDDACIVYTGGTTGEP